MSGYLDRPAAETVAVPDKVPLKTWRVIAAFVLAPMLAAGVLASIQPAYAGLPNYFEQVWRTAYFNWLFGALPPAIVFGIPAFLILKKVLRPTVLWCSMVGALVAATPWFFLSTALGGADYASINDHVTELNGHYTRWGWFYLIQFIGMVAAGGAVGGFAFWLIAAARWPWKSA